MKLPRTVRRIAPALVVLFLLTTIWIAYTLYAETHDAPVTSSTPVASYAEGATNGFVAALDPSYLYNNSTEIVGGNVTLFTPITNWINVTMIYSLSTNRTASIALHETFTAVLSTAVWSRTLFASSNASADDSTQILSLATHYAVNVSQLVGLATAIDTQIGYSPTSYTLSLSPEISGTLSAGGVGQPFNSNPILNFTFDGGVVVPSGLSYSSSGTLLSPARPTPPGPYGTTVLYVAFAASGVALAASVLVVARPREERTPPLDEVIAPYQEAIAETAAAPRGDVTIPVGNFADLAKIADTLGKPILRPTGTGPDRPEFFVLDGDISYSFRYSAAATRAAGARGDTGPGGGVPTAPYSGPAARVVQRLQDEADRLHGLPMDDATRQEVLHRIRRAIDLVHAKDLRDAAWEVDEISRLLDRAEMGASRSSS
ncbi:MAG: DUF5305 family protein [Thermoplasmata archaeon]